MMGMPMPPGMQAKIDEQVRQRKEQVAASLGKTLEEFDAEQHCCGHDHAHETGEHACASAEHGHDDHAHDSSETVGLASNVPEVDEKAVLDFIHSRQAVIEEQRSRIRALEAQVRHLESQKALEEKKCAALRDALAKMRAEAKASQRTSEPAG